jgi:photosynthetic reaction center cytochrome c subunit/tetratricopeptide repeat protein
MKRLLVAFGFLFIASVAFAQPPAGGAAQPPSGGATQPPAGGQAPPPMTNLQIIPKDTPRPVVLQQMQAIAQSLGVQCNYCHVFEGRGGRNDFASDEKSTKKTARAMMIMARDINQKMPLVVGKSAEVTTRVGCATCHRGVPIPKQITEVVTEAAANGGADAGLAKFKELREKFYGGQSYDFSETGLIAIAQRAQQANKTDDAIAYLKANLEYYPKSSRTYQVMAQIKNAKGDKEAAIKDLEKAVELDPNNAQAKAQLAQLKGQSQ